MTVDGYVASPKDVRTKAGDPMRMLNLADNDCMTDVVIWNKVFPKYYSALSSSKGLQIVGKGQENFCAYSLIAEMVEKIGFLNLRIVME